MDAALLLALAVVCILVTSAESFYCRNAFEAVQGDMHFDAEGRWADGGWEEDRRLAIVG